MSDTANQWPILTALLVIPLVGAAFVFFATSESKASQTNAKWAALWTTCVNFVLSLVLLLGFDASVGEFQHIEEIAWLETTISYRVGIDGISLPFVLLTTALMPVAILAGWDAIDKRVKEYLAAFLILETLMIGVFVALDLVLFYLFFEAVLIPMFLIIGIWGGKRRVYAAYKFFLYTFLGSLLMLVAIMVMFAQAGTTDIRTLMETDFAPGLQTWLWLAFFASFAVKMPMWPVHTWLPDAHVEAPTAGSVILAAILLKMGGYGFIRFSLPMFPEASAYFSSFVFALSVIAIVYTSLVALRQEDIKKLIAYSSVAHMGFVTMGIFTFTEQGIHGAMIQMISHGIISAALFLCVGVIYDRMHTREIAFYGGLVHRMPVYAAIFMVFTMGNVGLPGTSGFVGEFLSLAGAFQANTLVALVATTGVILSAGYMLWLYRRVVFGEMTNERLMAITDVNRRELMLLVPLVVLTLFFGIYPLPLFDMMNASVDLLMDGLPAALKPAGL